MDSKETNPRGNTFIDFLKATRMRILNGRVFGDTLGNFTCYSHTGSPSVIDYMASSIGLLSSIKSFKVIFKILTILMNREKNTSV